MKVGDSKQASILSVVAILIVGFAIYRVIPTPPKFAAPLPNDEGMGGPGKVLIANLPSTLSYDPFKMLPTSSPESAPSQESEADRQRKGKLPHIPRADGSGEGASLPPFDPLGKGEISGQAGSPFSSPVDESPGEGGKTDIVATVRVVAIVGIDSLSALISINGGAALTINTRDHVGPAMVVSITSSQVVLQGPKGKLALNVGDEAKL